jgi:two-component system sensor histidine kinase UhpB
MKMKNKIIFKNQKSRGTIESPIRLLIVIIFSIIVSDMLVWIFIKFLPPLTVWGELLIDSILISIILFPILYSFAFRPLTANIGERKLAEDALRQSEMKLKTLFEILPIGISIIDKERNMVFVNPALERILNITKDGFIRGDYKSRKYLRPDGTQMPEEEFASVRAFREQRAIHDVETGVVMENGNVIWTNVNAAPVTFPDWKVVIITTDITESKQAEEEIRKSKKLLENLHKHLNEMLESERALISREIHDQIGQSLTALKLDLNWMYKYVGTNPEVVMKLDNMIELISNTIKDVQRISSDLRPGILDDLGLAAAIEWYSGEFEERTGIRCRLKLDDSISGNSQNDLVFFRVLQEALTNVIRHANASIVSIKLHQSKQGSTLTIKDNGIGMHLEKVESGNPLGLIGMRERIRQVGGTLYISSGIGQGTKLTIFIPSK